MSFNPTSFPLAQQDWRERNGLSLRSLDFLARVTILRDCSQSIYRFSMPKAIKSAHVDPEGG